jgi:hypothetical protein
MFPILIKKYIVGIFSLYGLSSSLVFGLALEIAQVTFEDPNPGGANFPPLGTDRVEWDNQENLGVPYVSDAAVDIFTRYASTPALGQLANLGGGLVDVIDTAGNNTIDLLIDRLRRFYATDLQGFQTQIGLRASIPEHLCLAAVTIVSHVGPNRVNLPNGECFQFSTYFLDHLFVSGDAAHNVHNPAPVPPYLDAFSASEPGVFDFFGKVFPQVTLPHTALPGSYGNPTGPSIACDDQGGLQLPNGPATVAGDMFAFPHAPIIAGALGVVGLTPLNPNIVAYYNARWPQFNFAAGAPHSFGQNSGVDIGDLWFSGWWYSSGQLADPAHNRHSERALGVFLESIYAYAANNGLGGLPQPGAGALPQAPALPVAYVNAVVNLGNQQIIPYMLPNHPDIQPDAVEIYHAIQNTPNVVAVIIHIRNILRMCKTCANRWADFAQGYPVIAGGQATPLGLTAEGNRVRFIFMVGSGKSGAIEIYL